MRVGSNPMKDRQAPARLPGAVMAVITYLPETQGGYWLERMEIIQTCLTSMRKNAGMDAAVLVWDNGSCDKLRNWLRNVYQPDYLMESPNIGKTPARQSILRMFPFETIVAISDDDMLFYPDWMFRQVELLTKWPNVGSVTGYVNRAAFRWGIENTVRWAEEEAVLRKGQFIPPEWEADYATSVGINPAEWLPRISQEQDYLIEYRGMRAYATSHHCQFVCYAGRLAPLARSVCQCLSGEKQSDIDIDQAGLLRLATFERLSRHMGNRWDAKLRMEAEEMGLVES